MTATARVDRAAGNVDNQLFRALAVLRLVTLVFAVGINAVRIDDFDRPAGAVGVIATMAAWSALVTWLYAVPARRGPLLLGADLLVTLALLRTTPFVATDAMMAEHVSTLTSYWVCVPVLAWAVWWGIRGGVAAAVVVSVADVTMRPVVTASTIGNVFLLVLAGLTVGYVATTLRTSAQRRADAERRVAAVRERERLARAVHDGVLQVLGLMQRRGAEHGGDLADLGRLAGEQESALRGLIQTSVDPAPVRGQLDLVAALASLGTPMVTVATPGGPVALPADFVETVVAVVRACLANVETHVGPDAPAWVLLEGASDGVTVSVRDEGPGIADGRLDAAAASGRMGVARSIRGRVADLGGRADLRTSPGQGTEWEFTIPLPRGGRGRRRTDERAGD
ncbi:MacS family sensor histidine kinase [Solicola gregarius]|uniref:DUF5931 domain-containing protein n=1 Tax=Solicola gregarius TaxID=2908642 RepID=A0AA46THR5_9ACTN|nr:DUF5931 domain-containing protein [Solicola gregarius]UYM05388.1 DUF5931 domain-containing protein [Solicola gregarius]